MKDYECGGRRKPAAPRGNTAHRNRGLRRNIAGLEETSRDAGRSGKAISFSRVLDRVLLQGRQVDKALAAPYTFELGLPRVHALVLGQVLTLLEALIAAGTLEGFLASVHAAVALQLRRVFEPLLTVGAFQGLLPRGVTSVLDELGGRDKAPVAQGALQGFFGAVGILVPLQRGVLLVPLAAHVALVWLLHFPAAFVP